MRSPVVLLKRALYGHPLAGQSWYNHMKDRMVALGFTTVDGWDSVFVRDGVLVIVYVDDFILSGLSERVHTAAHQVSSVMAMGKAEPLSRFLACLYTVRPLTHNGHQVNLVEFDMRDYLRQCIAHYLELVSSVERDLAVVSSGKSLPRSKQYAVKKSPVSVASTNSLPLTTTSPPT